MLKIGKFILSSCATNCYFVYEEGSDKCVFFDPGAQGEYVYDKLAEAGLSVDAIYLTHGHFDHIEGCDALKAKSGAKIYALDKEAELIENPSLNLSSMFGRAYATKADELLRDGQMCEAAGLSFRVLATPGHTVGGCCYYFEEEKLLIAGDTLFEESVGRTDFPTSKPADLLHSIRDVLFELPDDVRVFPGHGEPTTIGHEKEYNPCV